MAEKVAGIRLFPDPDGKMNLGLAEVAGELLVVSQFTLYGDAGKGPPSLVRGRGAAGGRDPAVRALRGRAAGAGGSRSRRGSSAR